MATAGRRSAAFGQRGGARASLLGPRMSAGGEVGQRWTGGRRGGLVQSRPARGWGGLGGAIEVRVGQGGEEVGSGVQVGGAGGGDAVRTRRSGGGRGSGVQPVIGGSRGGSGGAGEVGVMREDDRKVQGGDGVRLQVGPAGGGGAGGCRVLRGQGTGGRVLLGLRGSSSLMQDGLQMGRVGGRGGSGDIGGAGGLREEDQAPQRERRLSTAWGRGSHGGWLRGSGSGAVIFNRGPVSAARRPVQVGGDGGGERQGQEERRLVGLGGRRDRGSYGDGGGEGRNGSGVECREGLIQNQGAHGRLMGGFRSGGAGRGVSMGGGGNGEASRAFFGERMVRREGNQVVVDRVTDWAEVGPLPTYDDELEGLEEEDIYGDGDFDDDDLLGEEEGEVIIHRQPVRRRLVVDEDEVEGTVDEVAREGGVLHAGRQMSYVEAVAGSTGSLERKTQLEAGGEGTDASDGPWQEVSYKRKQSLKVLLPEHLRGRSDVRLDKGGQVVWKCHDCGGWGHVAKDCKVGILCYECKGLGHIAPNCPNKGRRLPVAGKSQRGVVVSRSTSSSRMVAERAVVDTGRGVRLRGGPPSEVGY